MFLFFFFFLFSSSFISLFSPCSLGQTQCFFYPLYAWFGGVLWIFEWDSPSSLPVFQVFPASLDERNPWNFCVLLGALDQAKETKDSGNYWKKMQDSVKQSTSGGGERKQPRWGTIRSSSGKPSRRKWGSRSVREGVRNKFRNSLFKGYCIVFTSKRGFRNQFRTPSPKVREPHFLRFGLPEPLDKKQRRTPQEAILKESHQSKEHEGDSTVHKLWGIKKKPGANKGLYKECL